MKPTIAITIRNSYFEDTLKYHCNQAYINALDKLDCNYVIIAPNSNHDYSYLLDFCDGLLINGGDDIDSIYFNQPLHKTATLVSASIDEMDFALVKLFSDNKLPILGICRGLQIINVFFKGTLIQDIPSQYQTNINHSRNDLKDQFAHQIDIAPNTFLSRIFGTTTNINSIHHQAIKDVANNFKIVATSTDNIVEAIEKDNIIAVQFHPELLLQDERFHQIFVYFIDLCIKKDLTN